MSRNICGTYSRNRRFKIRETKRENSREETESSREEIRIVPDEPIATGATQNKKV
jgi:hypothetical protein